MTDRLSGWWR